MYVCKSLKYVNKYVCMYVCNRGFFGLVHWDAYFSLDPSASLVARLISDLLQETFDKIRLLAEYIDALKSS